MQFCLAICMLVTYLTGLVKICLLVTLNFLNNCISCQISTKPRFAHFIPTISNYGADFGLRASGIQLKLRKPYVIYN